MSEPMEPVAPQTSEPTATEPAVETPAATEQPASEAGGEVQTGTEDTGTTQDPNGDGASVAQSSETGTGSVGTYMPVYNGKVIPIDANQTEEITKLLQMGMKYRDTAVQREKLHALAAHYGKKSIEEFVETSLAAQEKALRDKLVQKYGEEDGGRLYEAQKAEREKTYGSFGEKEKAADAASRAAMDERIASEFIELQTEYPEFSSVKDVSPKVLGLALTKGISLLDAQNRYTLQQQKAAAAVKEQQQQNAKTSMGSMAGAADGSDPTMEAFLSGLKSRK